MSLHWLNDLPPKPASLQSGLDTLSSINEELARKTVVKPESKKKKSKQELKEEKQSLQSKVNTVKNLIDFVEKKHDSGTLDDRSYEKRITQLKADLKKAQDRIEEIDKKL